MSEFKKIRPYVERSFKERKKRQWMRRTLSVLSLIVALIVFAELSIPAITVTADPICGKSEHAHDSTCFAAELHCDLSEGEEHVHGENCYAEKLICTAEEHQHVQACYPEEVAEPTLVPQTTDAPVEADVSPDAEETAAPVETAAADAPTEAPQSFAGEETVAPTPEMTEIPTVVPTEVPTEEPTPTVEPTPEMTAEPTVEPTTEPTVEPTIEPIVIGEITGSSELLVGDSGSWNVTFSGANHARYEVLDANQTSVCSGALEIGSSVIEWKPTESGLYTLRVFAANETEEKSAEMRIAVSEGTMNAVLTASGKFARADLPFEFVLQAQGGVPPLNITATVTQDSSIIYEGTAFAEGMLTIVPEETGKATVLTAKVVLMDAAGNHLETMITLPCSSSRHETESEWSSSYANVQLTENWAENLISIAETQLGYHESEDNFIIDEDGVTQGFTRYGNWYGSSYADWCGMFVSFCLEHADIAERDFPREANCEKWIRELKEDDLYIAADEDYIPQPGDLIFFDQRDDRQNGDSDHVGIVTEVSEDKIYTIEGNIGRQVDTREYPLNDERIFGYGLLNVAQERCEAALATVEPTEEPTVEPTVEPPLEPTAEPTEEPTVEPTVELSVEPTFEPTEEPSVEPTLDPSVEPTVEPTLEPTLAPSFEPTVEPTAEPLPESVQIAALDGEVLIAGMFDAENAVPNVTPVDAESPEAQEELNALTAAVPAEDSCAISAVRMYDIAFEATSVTGYQLMFRVNMEGSDIRAAIRQDDGWMWLESAMTEVDGQSYLTLNTDTLGRFALVSLEEIPAETAEPLSLTEAVALLNGTQAYSLTGIDGATLPMTEAGSYLLTAGEDVILNYEAKLPEGVALVSGNYILNLPEALRYAEASGVLAQGETTLGEYTVAESGVMYCTLYDGIAAGSLRFHMRCQIRTDEEYGTQIEFSFEPITPDTMAFVPQQGALTGMLYAEANPESASLDLLTENPGRTIAIVAVEQLTDDQGNIWYRVEGMMSDEALNKQIAEYPYVPEDAIRFGTVYEMTNFSTNAGHTQVSISGELPIGAVPTVETLDFDELESLWKLIDPFVEANGMGIWVFGYDIAIGDTHELPTPVKVAIEDLNVDFDDISKLVARVYHIHEMEDDEYIIEELPAIYDENGIAFEMQRFSKVFISIDAAEGCEDIYNSFAETGMSPPVLWTPIYLPEDESASMTKAKEKVVFVEAGGYNDTLEASDSQIADEGGTNTNDDNVSVSKTINGTEFENVFDITLHVQTTQDINVLLTEPDMAVVIVMDISNTMNEKYTGSTSDTTRYVSAMNAAQAFIDDFSENTSQVSKIGFVAFNTNVHDIFDLSSCSNASQANALKNTMASATNSIISANGYADSHTRFTNIEGGLMRAKEMLAGANNKNKYIIFLSDGFPTTYVKSGKTGYDPYMSSNRDGYTTTYADRNKDGYFYDAVAGKWCLYGTSYSDKAAIRAREQATIIKNSGIKIFSIGVDIGGQTIDEYERPDKSHSIIQRTGSTYEIGSSDSTSAYKNWLRHSIGSGDGFYYDSTDASGLITAFEKIFEQIKEINGKEMQGLWVVSDDMPVVGIHRYVECLGIFDKNGTLQGHYDENGDVVLNSINLKGEFVQNGENTASLVENVNGTQLEQSISWDLKNSGYQVEQVSSTTKRFHYTIKYRVRLRNEDPNFSEMDTLYATNGDTAMQYRIITQKNDSFVYGEPTTIYFPVPAVVGYLEDLGFQKINQHGEPVVGAEFQLSHAWQHCGNCRGDGVSVDIDTRTTTSWLGEDGNSYVLFEDIPSGHDYHLKETRTLDGYLQPTQEYHVEIAFNKLRIWRIEDYPDPAKAMDLETFIVTNVQGAVLPVTGGIGTTPYILAGTLLMAVPVVYIFAQKRMRGRGCKARTSR